MARTAEIELQEFINRYNTEEACREELFRLRFPNGFVCPKCGHREYYHIKSRGLYQCKDCRRQTSVTAGTIMHRTHLPLTNWFWAIYLVSTDKRGISAVGLQEKLKITYEAAWYLLSRIRSAMGQRDSEYFLSGIVEMDDGYIGGPTSNGKRGRGTEKAQTVVALSKTGKGIPKFLRMKLVENIQGKTLQSIVDAHIKPGSKIECDGYSSYRNLSGVELNVKNYEVGDLKWLHTVLSNFKTFLKGTHHGRCTKFQAYMDEFCFRFNRRMVGSQLFLRTVRAVALSCGVLS